MVTEVLDGAEPENQAFKSWVLPDVSKAEQIIPSFEKEQKEKNNAKSEEEEVEQAHDSSAEHTEQITTEELETPSLGISAEELQAITEAAKEEGYQAGFKKGLKEGEEKGFASGQEKLEQTLSEQSQRLKNLMDALLIPLQSEQEALEKQLVEIITRLCRAVISRELKTDSSLIRERVAEVLALLPNARDGFSLSINPQDKALIETYLGEVFHDSEESSAYQLIEDDSLLPGGCHLKARKLDIRHQMEDKIEKVIDDFVHQHWPSRTDEPVDDGEQLTVSSEENTTIKAPKKIKKAKKKSGKKDKDETHT